MSQSSRSNLNNSSIKFNQKKREDLQTPISWNPNIDLQILPMSLRSCFKGIYYIPYQIK